MTGFLFPTLFGTQRERMVGFLFSTLSGTQLTGKAVQGNGGNRFEVEWKWGSQFE
ncbi:hypothetical protein TIFTF001_020488 [Ficus carica]|uniref:Uncharacterized protein n=1 Tax=Ficus carica TaxID=3494 RepID=A0AA88DJL7_FICCA|nr:hypothetical protein TIFTF001_020488 [Ficus carica]